MSDDQPKDDLNPIIKDYVDTVSIYHSDDAAVQGWEVNTMMARAEDQDELESCINYLRGKYHSNIVSITRVPKRKDKSFYYAVVIYKTPLVERED